MAHNVVGIDAAASGIKVVVFDASLRGVELKRAQTVPWQVTEVTAVDAPPPAETTKRTPETVLARQIVEVCDQLDVGGDLYLGWDSNKASTRMLSFPINDMRKIEGMLDFELEDQLARGLDEIVYAHIPISITRDKTDILVATTERAPVRDFIETMSAAGRSPRSIFVESLSLFALAGSVGTGMIVDIGHTKTQVIIIADGKPLFSRSLREGGRRIDLALAKALGCDEETAHAAKERSQVLLPHEQPASAEDTAVARGMASGLRSLVIGLKQTLLPYLAHLGSAPDVYITGGMALMPGLDRYLTVELGADTKPLPLPAALAAMPDGHRYAMAYSLAVTGAQSARHPRLDFRVGDLSFRGDMSGLRAQARNWAIGAAIVIALAFVAGLSRYMVLRADEKQLDESLKQVTKALMGHEMSDFKQAITAIRQSVNPEKSALPRYSALDYFAVVSQRIAGEIDIKTTEVELRQDKILMKGDGLNYEMIDKAVEALKGHECFKQVILGKTRKTLDGTRVEFSVQIDLSCGSNLMEKYLTQVRAFIAKGQDSFSRLSERERTIVMGVVVVVGTLSFVFSTFSIIKGIDKASRQVAYKSEQLREIIGLRDVYKKAQDQNAAFRARLTGNDIRLTSLVEEEARKLGFEVSNLSPHTDPADPGPSGVREQKVDLRVQKMTYDRLMKFLEQLESQSKPVRVIRLKVNNRFDEKDLVDAEMTVATYKASS